MSSQDIHARSVTTTPMPSVQSQKKVTKLVDVSRYTGCRVCQATCSEWSELRGEVGHNRNICDNPMDLTTDSWTVIRFTEHKNEAGNLEQLIRKDDCMRCTEPGCLKAYPSPGATVKYANGIVNFNQDKCIGYGYYIIGYPSDIPRILQRDHKVYKCNPCSDHVSVGMEPVCVKTCPTDAITFSSREDMKEHAVECIVDLKSHGYGNAGLYDPEGVDGTHVIYVLYHADKSSLYAGLVDQPNVGPLVSLQKGVAESLALLAMGATALAGSLHHVRVGPNRADDGENHGQVETPVHQTNPSVHAFDLHERR